MRDNVEAKAVRDERVQGVVVAIDRPVLAELLGTKNEHPFIFQLEIFDYCQRLECFTQANAVGEYAPVVFEDLVYGAFDAVALELEEGLPYLGVHNLNVLVEEPSLFLVG